MAGPTADTVIPPPGRCPWCTRYTMEQVREVQQLYAAGASYAEIMSRTGVPRGSIFYVLRIAPGVPPQRRSRDARGRFQGRIVQPRQDYSC